MTLLCCITIKAGITKNLVTLGKTYSVIEWVEHKYGKDPVIECDDGKVRLMPNCLFHD